MNNINYTKIQDWSEIDCVKRFLPDYNKYWNKKYKNPIKNVDDNKIEIDVICPSEEGLDSLKIQIKRADPVAVGQLGRSRSIIDIDCRPLITRDRNQAHYRIVRNIKKVETKYQKQGKDMSDTILLLDEMFNPPGAVMEAIGKEVTTSIFKEIWLVNRQGESYRLF